MISGDDLEQLYLEARDDVYRYLIHLGLNPAQAQDTTQDVFLRLHRAVQAGDDIRQARAWVFRVAHNLGLNEKQRKGNQSVAIDAQANFPVTDPSPTVEEAALERERHRRLQDAMERLSPQQRQCLYLRAEGLRYAEIAQSLGIAVSTVAEFVSRATARLRKEVA
ncbi:MAG: sigma-70 family RNA polymerase sigma factor [Bryobacterales bacterium]|nr:sigma-70 family RNA polymerase sigma factor [Bryobacterales bacterium]